MLDQEKLLELTESYLKSLVAGSCDSLGADFDASIPFRELGVDSFRVLKIIKGLEADFGNLPKTLLFENFNVEALAAYFVARHQPTLMTKFAIQTSAPAALQMAPSPSVVAANPVDMASAPVVATPAAEPWRLLERDLFRYPELEAVVRSLFEQYKNEGGVSRGTRNIAPNLFVGAARRGYFNYARSRNLVLIYAYTGPADYFAEISAEMQRYCAEKGFQLNIFTDGSVSSVDGIAFSSTPFGALQRVLNIQEFSLEGGAMRRLRYQLSKFEKSGVCRTVEYQCGSDPAVDRSIAAVIDQWCETKPMVNPLIHIVREEILAGSLHPQHRIFLTYVDDVLQNVILISALCRELNGYLMDLEFYPKGMPLGGLEFAIVRIIETLVAEGCNLLSLGGTYGCRLETSPDADPDVDRILDDLHQQNIFNDEGNLQFKNKFRPENRTIYLCRPVGSGNADNVIDIIMMIADPAKAQTSDEENHNAGTRAAAAASAPSAQVRVIDGEPRSPILAEFGFNPINIPSDRVEFDLKTDSWAQLDAPFIAKRMSHLRAQLQQPVNVNDGLAMLFPFKYFVLTDAGRSADHLFCKAWPKKGIVLQNLLFPTCIFHQIDKGLAPRELPHADLFRVEADQPGKAHLCWDSLQQQVAAHAPDIAYVCIEVGNNAAGGQPVSIAHLRQVKELLAAHSIALVIDATRVLENAGAVIESESGYAGQPLWQVAREILGFADVVIGSLAKDFGVNKGGLIATNDESLLRRLQDLLQREGGGLDVIDKKLVGLALQHRSQIEALVLRRMQAVRIVWQALRSAGVPVCGPVGGHCVLVDVKRLVPLAGFANPVASFLAWLYLNTGIRAGAHSVGMQQNTSINGMARLAIPLGLRVEDAEEIARRLLGLFAEKKNIPELALSGVATESFGDVHANYTLLRYHAAAQPAVQRPAIAAAPASIAPLPSAAPVAYVAEELPRSRPEFAVAVTSRSDIAVVGMAGRYPKSRSMDEFWQNLRQGRDCVDDIPQERVARRTPNGFSQRYRGGFLDEVERFDSLFFNISPREAEILDPQERLFLEVAWEALEDGGYYPEILAHEQAPRNVGVFVGAVWAMYQIVGVEEKLAGNNANPNSFLWSIANRVSYWMNFTGPSLTVDTACSSSLTAIYLACEAIRNGDCSSAIVGGVNLDLHQHKFDINQSGGALSADGVCRSFGAGANGYVAGEGVGAIFIKPLDKALEDNDNIYGVIKGVAVNHGGRTSGYTVPNPKAQGELIVAALDKAGVDARTLGYIEAHGTGTELGDPVEISGLTHAFESYATAAQSCAIGSVKSNIGHLEAAAGVVGVCKVLLQMRHRELVPSLHSAQLNEHIDFSASSFYVQQQLQPWTAKEVGGIRFPLRAGVSSFGAGGANAHVILEAFEPEQQEAVAQPEIYVFPLSARNDEQLRETALRLRAHVADAPASLRLQDVAFTLQNGRKSFEHRLVVLAATRRKLLDKLDLFLQGQKDADILSGHARNAEGITKLLSRREREQFVALLSQSRDPHKLAQMWLDGLLSDCRGFPHAGGRRMSLPTYPFADKRHWIGTVGAASRAVSLQARGGLHPLIDSNESTFQRQLFRKTFHAHEFFLRDHRVSDIPTLPGTAYLDLARKAGEVAAGRRVHKIRNVTWVSPLAVDGAEPLDALIELKPGGDSVSFDVFSETADGKKKLYAQGKLIYADDAAAAGEAEYIDLAAIRARCTTRISGRDAYPAFRAVGLNYGPSFQLLQEVLKSDEEVLGLLQLPSLRGADFDQFVLHPCLLDASMQAGVAAQLGDATGEIKVPYSIGEVELLHPLTRTCYSYVTKVRNERNTASGVSRENVTLVDESGKVLARIRESVGVPLVSVHEKPFAAPAAADETFVELHYAPLWREAPLAAQPADVRTLLLLDNDDALRTACAAHNVRTILVLPGERFEDAGSDTFRIAAHDRDDYLRLFDALQRQGIAADKICYAWGDPAEPADQAALGRALDRSVFAFLYLCQALIAQKPSGRVQLIHLSRSSLAALQPHDQAINGFVRSLRLENPKIDAKVLEICDTTAAAQCVAPLLAELHAAVQGDITLRYDAGLRYVRTLQRLEPAEVADAAAPVSFKHDGAYLITGGGGGLGLVFAEFLARQCKAKLVLVGRSTPSPAQRERFDALRQLGAEVLYVAGDIASADDAARVLGEARARFGRLSGIVHSAGVLRDSFLRNKTREDMQAVFAPKIYGAFHLDRLTRDDDLDFFATFSSLAAIGGNAGQCDYAFANHFLDSFAAQRDARRQRGERKGHSLSLNWSLWAEGGMKLDEQTEILFRKNLGIKPLQTSVGVAAFARALLLQRTQIAVLEGVQAKIERAWGLVRKEPAAAAPAAVPAAATGGSENLPGQVMAMLSEIVMALLKLPAEDLSLDSILLDLGFDSIGLTTFANAINDKYRLDINPILFFEYPSIRAIAGVLASEHRRAVEQVHGAGAGAAVAAPAAAEAPADDDSVPLLSKGWQPASPAAAGRGDFSRAHRFSDVPIAIVGIAGVMPQSADVEEFWDNLSNARNLVTDIPRERWIWEDYDGNPVKEVNKSNSRWGGFMREVDKFDPLFFGITPREAEMMDPQQRIFLETVCSAIEDAGHRISDLSGTKTGLFVGVSAKDYIDVLAEQQSTLDGFSASGNSHSILANRVSFLLNLRGPSAPLDTACSSSLIALHRAIESIHTGSSDMAIVGGVQVMLTPVGHISLSSAGMLSVDGKCKTFDKDANGYVRGEGSGAIFIKTLAQAEADGNPIYAVIKATAENYGGRVTMLTAPNPKAQAELLFEAYTKAEVDPASIGFIECHGTGTSLGDPIEIQALKKSFADLYREYGSPAPTAAHCGLSSVKTNIGHLEPAAGIASLLKVLLAIKHKQIPALLHFEELNPYIDLAGSPFYIVDKTVPWHAPNDREGRPLPRRAGVSSFGWGGANAHVVLEEYPALQPAPATGAHAVLLSARNENRLRAYARTLLAHVRRHSPPLAELAYTLQIGRDAMDERLGVLASSSEDLADKLQAFVDGSRSADGVYRGQVSRYKRNEQGLSAIETDSDDARRRAIDGWIAARNQAELLQSWIGGADVDWSRLHPAGGARPRRLSLPTYPFARDRHWIENSAAKKPTKSAVAALHPLLHGNSSTLDQVRYSSVFSGKEFFFAPTQKTLPAAAYLEMARAAISLAKPAEQGSVALELRQIQWTPAIAVSERRPLYVDLHAARNAQVDYEIHSTEFDAEGRPHQAIHCRGTARFERRPAPTRFDVEQLKALMTYGRLGAARIEALSDRIAPARTAALNAIQAVHHGYHQLLLQLDLPASVAHTADDYVLHPALLDSVLFAAAALATDLQPAAGYSSLPGGLESLQLLAPCSGEIYAWIRHARGQSGDGGAVTLDVDLLDSQGTLCARLRSLSYPVTRARAAAASPGDDFAALLDSVYRLQPAAADGTDHSAFNEEFERILEDIL